MPKSVADLKYEEAPPIIGSPIMSKRKAGEGLPFGTKAGKAVRFDDNVQESEEGFIGPGPLPAERGAEGETQEDKPEKQVSEKDASFVKISPSSLRIRFVQPKEKYSNSNS